MVVVDNFKVRLGELPGFLIAIVVGAAAFLIGAIIAYAALIFFNSNHWYNVYYLLELFIFIIEGIVLFILPCLLVSSLAKTYIKNVTDAVVLGSFTTGITGVFWASFLFFALTFSMGD